MHSLETFSLRDMTECSAALRQFGSLCTTEQDVAKLTVKYLYDNLGSVYSGERCLALVRFFSTRALAELPDDQKKSAHRLLGRHPETPNLKCLCLLASAGAKEDWNHVGRSRNHQAIPLPSPKFISASPMIARLVSQFGLELDVVVSPDPQLITDLAQSTFNVFHVPDALGSPYVPAQDDFVVPYGIRSVLGFGGILPSGDLFSVILFSRATITRDTAELFKPLALSVKVSLLSVGK